MTLNFEKNRLITLCGEGTKSHVKKILEDGGDGFKVFFKEEFQNLWSFIDEALKDISKVSVVVGIQVSDAESQARMSYLLKKKIYPAVSEGKKVLLAVEGNATSEIMKLSHLVLKVGNKGEASVLKNRS